VDSHYDGFLFFKSHQKKIKQAMHFLINKKVLKQNMNQGQALFSIAAVIDS